MINITFRPKDLLFLSKEETKTIGQKRSIRSQPETMVFNLIPL